jgi:hypothetical protein
MDYDTFYNDPSYESFVDKSKIDPCAREIVERVLQHCTGNNPQFPKITCLIDLGCGNGELFHAIINEFKRELHKDTNRAFKAYGIDTVKRTLVKKARAFTYIKLDLNDKCFTRCEPLKNIPWHETAILCLCHTWPHFINDTALEAVKCARPALLLIGLYHSWDKVLDKLFASTDQPVLEPRRIEVSGTIYSLRTEWKDKDHKIIFRGVSKCEIASPEQKWLIPTVQIAKRSDEYFGPQASPPPKMDSSTPFDASKWVDWGLNAAQAGHLTGDANYIVADDFTQDTPWDVMRTRALVAINPDAEKVNKIYSGRMRQVVRKLFVLGEDGMPIYESIRNLLSQFNALRKGRKWYVPGVREAAVLEPFDPNRVFARVCSLFKQKDDTQIFKLRTILEDPERGQLRYRSAYALYRTMLDQVSCPEAFPLSQLPGYSYSNVDYVYEDLEARFLSPTGDPRDLPKDGFFVVPIYFGSLPLFSLILPPHPQFDREVASAEVYQAIFTNLHDQIRLRLTDDFLKLEIIRPLIDETLPKLQETGMERRRNIEEAATVLSRLLCGYDILREEKAMEGRDLGGVLGRPWKSWLWTVPSLCLRDYAEVVEENRRLMKLFRAELALALSGPEKRISSWCQEGALFAGNNHANWICKNHPALLKGMLKTAFGSEEIPTEDDLSKNEIAVKYFGAAHSSYLLRWLLKKARDISTHANENCQHCVVLSNEPCCQINKDLLLFPAIKSVFCKTLENTGAGVRFGTTRLWHLIDAAMLDIGQPKPCLNELPYWEEDGKHLLPNDASIAIADLVHWFAVAKCAENAMLSSVKLETDLKDDSHKGYVKILVTCNAQITEDERGQDCKGLRQQIELCKSKGVSFEFSDCKMTCELKININLSKEP